MFNFSFALPCTTGSKEHDSIVFFFIFVGGAEIKVKISGNLVSENT